mmetsp:Transcript_17117/g.54644  ORF Transcript_17117/g.54644 Transcript_17117/m.54644 type:complete len:208 (+) Transcript_17117:3195-3818(+)
MNLLPPGKGAGKPERRRRDAARALAATSRRRGRGGAAALRRAAGGGVAGGGGHPTVPALRGPRARPCSARRGEAGGRGPNRLGRGGARVPARRRGRRREGGGGGGAPGGAAGGGGGSGCGGDCASAREEHAAGRHVHSRCARGQSGPARVVGAAGRHRAALGAGGGAQRGGVGAGDTEAAGLKGREDGVHVLVCSTSSDVDKVDAIL